MPRLDYKSSRDCLSPALCFALLVNGFTSTAAAQDTAASAPDRNSLEEIVVTAQKREERVIDVPLSISAFTDALMRDAGVVQLADFLESAPGVGAVDSGGPTQQTIQIRGINSVIGDAPIGFYLDELPFSFIGNAQVPDVRTFDLERVEVLRGPQGTLYGDGSIGGTIRVLTRDPNLDSVQADVDVTGMDTEDGEASSAYKGMFNLPIKEGMAALRLVATKEDLGGWIDNTSTGVADQNRRDVETYRAKLRLTPTDKLDIVLSAWRTDQSLVDSSAALDDGTNPNPRQTGDSRADLYSVNVKYDFGAVHLVSATSYMEFSLATLGEYAGLPLVTDQTQKALSEELRLTSSDEGMFRWTAGLFYRKLERPITAQVIGLRADQYADSKSYAVFGEGTWSLFDSKLDLTLGLRYFEDDRVRDDPVDAATLALIQTIDPSFTGRVDSSFDTLNPRFNLAFHVNDRWMVYTNVAKGFRTGQVQPVTALILAALSAREVATGIDPEKLWSYELGTKASLADGRVIVEGAVYYNDWDNLQLNVVLDPVTLLSAYANGGSARTQGIELSASLRPTDGLDLRLSASRLSAKYTESVPGANVRDGDRISGVPETTLAASATYRWPLGALSGFAHTNVQYTSDRVDYINMATPSDDTTPVDVRLGVEGGSWGLYLFGDNVTNEDGAIDVGLASNGGASPRLRPRTYGINARYSFR